MQEMLLVGESLNKSSHD